MKTFKRISITAIISIGLTVTNAQDYFEKPLCAYTLSENTEESKQHYFKHEKCYTINETIDNVWKVYTNSNAKEVWQYKSSKYLISFDNSTKLYNNLYNQSFDSVKVNKTYGLELTFLKFVKIPVVFQITKIDHDNKVIQFTYMKENKSNGFQTIEFIDLGGKTIIKHTSYYKSGKKFRDKKIYPFFHEVATDDFHNRMTYLVQE